MFLDPGGAGASQTMAGADAEQSASGPGVAGPGAGPSTAGASGSAALDPGKSALSSARHAAQVQSPQRSSFSFYAFPDLFSFSWVGRQVSM